MKSIIQNTFLVLFIVTQIYFVGAILLDHNLSIPLTLLVSCMVLFLVLAYRKRERLHLPSNSTFNFGTVPLLLIGTFITVLSQALGLNSVLSAGLTGFIGSLTPHLPFKNVKTWPAAIYCGAFVGMTSMDLGYGLLALAALLASLFYVFTQNWFHGIGGKLGTIAFMGVLYAYIIYHYILAS